MTYSVSKTVFVSLHRADRPDITSHKMLGVYMDQKLLTELLEARQ